MNDEIKKKSFIIYEDHEIVILRLRDDEAGKLFKSLFPYSREKIKPNFDENPALAIAFDILKMAIDRDEEKYLKRCEANRQNVKKRWSSYGNQSNTIVYDGNQSYSKHTDNDNDNNNDNDNDNNNNNDNNTNNNMIIGMEPDKPAPDPSGILLPLNDNTLYDVPLDKIATWHQAYPAVDVNRELQKMKAWLESNPKRRKTRQGICRFINIWLSKEQDEGGIYRNGGSRQQETAPVNNDLPPEYQEMYAKYLGKNPPDPDAPFQ